MFRIRMLTLFVISCCAVILMATGSQAMEKKGEVKDKFAGSTACQKCHKEEFKSWNETLHSKMVMKKDDGILKAVVEYVVGSHWKQRFLVKDDTTGGYQLMDKQFNRMSGEWEPYGNANDWDQMCATCHTTGYHMTSYDAANPKAAKATWIELNVGCEACHGPGAKHVKTKSKKDIFNPVKQSKAEQSRLCGTATSALKMRNIRALREHIEKTSRLQRSAIPSNHGMIGQSGILKRQLFPACTLKIRLTLNIKAT